MAKKNPYIFTIGFDATNPIHRKAVEILNSRKSKASYIAEAVVYLVEETEQSLNSDVDQATLISMVERVVQQEVKKAFKDYDALKTNILNESEDIVAEDMQELPLDMSNEVMKAIQNFRKG